MAGECPANVVLRTMRTLAIPRQALGDTVSVQWVIGLLPYPMAGLVVAIVPLPTVPTVLAVCGLTMGLAVVVGGRQLDRQWHQHATQARRPDSTTKPAGTVPAREPNRARTAEPV